MVTPRSYTPLPARPADLRGMLDRAGLDRVVVVQISVYGADNTCVMDGLKALGPCARGVVQVDAATSPAALDAMHKAGVRGVRVNLDSIGVRDPDDVRRRLDIALAACDRNGWHLQLFTSPTVLTAIAGMVRSLPVPVVIDHFGLLPVHDRGGEAERLILDLLASGRGWVKISAPYRLDHDGDENAVASLARDLYRANPERIVWGSDWPHPPKHASKPEPDPAPRPYRAIDPVDMLAMIARWFDDTDDHDRILVTNPGGLYDFPAE